MSKEVKVPKSRGALRTGFTYAPVLLFELYLAINNTSTSHSASFGIRLLYELRATGVSYTSHYSPSKKIGAPELRILLLYESFPDISFGE